jgi:hypothetical protein
MTVFALSFPDVSVKDSSPAYPGRKNTKRRGLIRIDNKEIFI